jgi:hypothetical protein
MILTVDIRLLNFNFLCFFVTLFNKNVFKVLRTLDFSVIVDGRSFVYTYYWNHFQYGEYLKKYKDGITWLQWFILSQYSVWLRAGRPVDRGSISGRCKNVSSSVCVQTGSGAHLASCTMGTGGIFSGVKARPGRDADHSPPSSAEDENE